MTRLFAVTGTLLLTIGWIKSALHAAAQDRFAAFWCRTPGVELQQDAWWAGLQAHCWGCWVALAGAAMVAVASVRLARDIRSSLRVA